MLLAWIFFFSVIGSVGALAGAALMLTFPDRVRDRLLPALLGYATGTLLGAAFLGMIPKALAGQTPIAISSTLLAGIVGFFILEKLVIWRHAHEQDGDSATAAGPLILVGDAFHNFFDGIVIASAFLTSVPLGISVSLAVVAHEIPQEVGDFAILLDNGYSRTKALTLNLLSSLATLPGALIGFYFLAEAKAIVPFILALSASSFIYIAVADLVPGLTRQRGFRVNLVQLLLLFAGIATIGLFHFG
jgi:zinc and cadmium transporter